MHHSNTQPKSRGEGEQPAHGTFGEASMQYPADLQGSQYKMCIDMCWPVLFFANTIFVLFVVFGMTEQTLKSMLLFSEARRADAPGLGYPDFAAASICALMSLGILIGLLLVLVFIMLQSWSPGLAVGLVLSGSVKVCIGLAAASFVYKHFVPGVILAVVGGFGMLYICARWQSIRLSADIGSVLSRMMKISPGLMPGAALVLLFPGIFVVACANLLAMHLFVVSRMPEPDVPRVEWYKILYMAFMLYWALGVMANYTYALGAGSVSRWYYGDYDGSINHAFRQVSGRSGGAVVFSAFIRGPVIFFRFLGYMFTCCEPHQRHDKGNESASRLLAMCFGGCIRTRRAASLMFLNRDALTYVMFRGEDLCTGAHLLATHRFGTGFQDIADSNLTGHLSGVVSVFTMSVVAFLVMAMLMSTNSVHLLCQEVDMLGNKVAVDQGWHGLLGFPWPVDLFFPICAAVSAGIFTHISGFIEGGSHGLIAAWAEHSAELERINPKLHGKLRAHVIAYGADPDDPAFKDLPFKHDSVLSSDSWDSEGSEGAVASPSRRTGGRKKRETGHATSYEVQ